MVNAAFVGDQFYYTRNALTPVQKGELADYALVDLKLTQRLLGERLAVYAGATNLYKCTIVIGNSSCSGTGLQI